MNMNAADSAEWESWPADVVVSEATTFAERAQMLVGLREEQLKRKIGAPSELVGGTQWESASRQSILQADRDLRYFHLLPHAIVSFAIADGFVARDDYMPKWRRCPPDFESRLRGAYAPE